MHETSQDKTPPPVQPTGSDGVAIHLSYIRRDIDEIKTNNIKNYEEIKNSIASLASMYPNREEFNGLKEQVDNTHKRLDGMDDYPTVKRIVYGAVTLILVGFLGAVIYIVIPHH